VSRGGTRKARAEQERRRRTQRRKEQGATSTRKKRSKEKRPRKGRGRAAVLHLSGFAGPIVLSFGLLLAGQTSSRVGVEEYWMGGLVDSPNASYLSEPGGLVYAAAVFSLAALLFLFLPVRLWRHLYRSHSVLERDWTSVDGPFTLMAVIGLVWIYRVFFGFGDPLSTFAVLMSTLSVYVPVFSALLAIGMPVIRGSGRIGGILPGWLRMGFTERYLLNDDEREILRVFAEAKKQAEEEAAP
jgi:hypothetical protein